MDRSTRPYIFLADLELGWVGMKFESTAISGQYNFKYGDAIHLARAMANSFSDEYFDAYDDCDDVKIRSLGEGDRLSTLKIYPNPSTGVFNIELPQDFTGHISVLDVTGRVVYTNRIDKEFDSTLDLSAHPGVLFIQIADVKGVISTHKVMVIN